MASKRDAVEKMTVLTVALSELLSHIGKVAILNKEGNEFHIHLIVPNLL